MLKNQRASTRNFPEYLPVIWVLGTHEPVPEYKVETVVAAEAAGVM